MIRWSMGFVSCVLAAGCGNPAGPTPLGSGPGATPVRTTWEGTLTRSGVTASVNMSVQQTPLATGHLLGGTFVVVYPSATYSGSVGGVSETAFWEVLLLPSVSRQCPVPLTTSSGATILTLTPAGSRMTGEATLVECEGRTTWAAEFTRR